MRDAVLIIGGGLLQIPAIQIGRDMGLTVVVTDGNPKAPGMELADEAVPLDIYDLASHRRLVTQLATRYRLLGVFAEGADVELTVAVAAEQAGLPGIPAEAARRCKNKALMRQAFDQAGLGQVPWGEARTTQEARSWAETIGCPVAVKAVDNCGSRGFTRVTSLEEVEAAFLRAAAASTTGTALVEACLTGTEQSVELLFDATGVCHRLNVVDRIFGEGPWAIELGHVNPSQLDGSVQQALFELAEQAAAAVGVRFGAFKADMILTADGPRILEVTARLSGGFDCQYTTPLATGRNFIRAALSLAVGRALDPEDLRRTKQRCAAAWTVFPEPGVVWAITGIDAALALPGVKHVFLRSRAGEVIPPYRDCVARPAFVIVEGRDADEVLVRAKAAAALVQIKTVTDSVTVA